MVFHYWLYLKRFDDPFCRTSFEARRMVFFNTWQIIKFENFITFKILSIYKFSDKAHETRKGVSLNFCDTSLTTRFLVPIKWCFLFVWIWIISCNRNISSIPITNKLSRELKSFGTLDIYNTQKVEFGSFL